MSDLIKKGDGAVSIQVGGVEVEISVKSSTPTPQASPVAAQQGKANFMERATRLQLNKSDTDIQTVIGKLDRDWGMIYHEGPVLGHAAVTLELLLTSWFRHYDSHGLQTKEAKQALLELAHRIPFNKETDR